MTARLPTPGGDDNTWGDVLNTFLEVAHNSDGSLQPSAVTAAGAYSKPSTGIPATDLSSSVQASIIAANSAVQIGGDLSGAASSPTVAKINGVSVNGTPSVGEVLVATSGSAAKWANAPVSWINVVTAYGADPTGAVDATSAIQSAVNALGTGGGHQTSAGGFQGGGVVYLPAGTYKVSGTVTVAAGAITIMGDGRWSTFIKHTGTGDCIRMIGPSVNTFMGGVKDLTIDGTGSTAPATGLHIGDGIQYAIDLSIQEFSGTGSIGLHIDNTEWWTEQLHGTVHINTCQAGVVFDVNGSGYNSFARTDLTVYIQAGIGQDGVVVQNGALLYDSALSIWGNFASSATTAMSNAVLRVTGQAPAGDANITAGSYSVIRSSRLDIGVETPANTYTPQTINFGNPAASNAILGCYGSLDFSTNNNPFTKSNYVQGGPNTFIFFGPIAGDVNLNGTAATSYAAGSTTALLYAQGDFNTTTGNLYIGNGDFFSVTLTQNVTITFKGQFLYGGQRKTIIVKQATSGGPYTITWPKPASPGALNPAVYWAGGVAPTMSTGAGAIDKYVLESFDGAHWYGSVDQNLS